MNPPGHDSLGTEEPLRSHTDGREEEEEERRFGQRFQDIVLLDDSLVRLSQSQFHLDQALHMPNWLHLGVDFRTRYESYSQPVKKNETTGGAQFSERTNVNVEARYKWLKVHAEYLDARPLSNFGVIVSNRMEDQNTLLQLYGSLSTDNFLGSYLPTELQLGKFTQDFGRRRLIARSQYNNVPYSFIGAHWTLGSIKDWNIRAFAMRPYDIDQTQKDKVDSNTWFMGVSYLDQRLAWLHLEPYVYFLTQKGANQGSNGLNQDQSQQGVQQNLYSLGFRLFRPESKRTFDYELESTYQLGRGALQRDAQPLPVFAFYQHVEVGYTFALPWSPAFHVKYDYASGQTSPTGDRNSRFNTLYGANSFEFAPSGIWGLFKRSNISSPGYVISVHPTEELKARFQHRFWWLAQATDLFQGAQLQDPTGRAGTYLGSDLSLTLAWTVSSNLLLEGGGLYLFKGSYYSNLLKEGIPGSPNDKDTNYVFLSVRLIF